MNLTNYFYKLYFQSRNYHDKTYYFDLYLKHYFRTFEK